MITFDINIVTHIKYDMACNLIKQFRKFLPTACIRIWDNSPYQSSYEGADDIRWHRFNPSLSRTWNWAIAQSSSDWVMVTNEDIRLEEDWLSKLEIEMQDYPSSLWHGPSRHFLFNKQLLKRVGWFDEGLTGHTYEDLDYIRRMNHEGVPHRYGKLSCLELTAASLKATVGRDLLPCDNKEYMAKKYNSQDTENFYNTPNFPTPDFYPLRQP